MISYERTCVLSLLIKANTDSTPQHTSCQTAYCVKYNITELAGQLVKRFVVYKWYFFIYKFRKFFSQGKNFGGHFSHRSPSHLWSVGTTSQLLHRSSLYRDPSSNIVCIGNVDKLSPVGTFLRDL